MNRIFAADKGFTVPDGTTVYSLLDPAGLGPSAGEWAEEISVALGCIPPHTASKIHLHPLVTQVTWVIAGQLTLTMKDPAADAPYTVSLAPEQAAIALPGTFFQLINRSETDVRVLYIVTPAFIFEASVDGRVLYNDALVFDEDWGGLAAAGWTLPELNDLEAARTTRRISQQRLRQPTSPVRRAVRLRG